MRPLTQTVSLGCLWFDLLFKISPQRIHSNGHAPTFGCLISVRNLCMKLTVYTKMAAPQTSFEYFAKIGDPQHCLLKLTGQNCCSSYFNTLEVVPWRHLQFTWNWNWKNSLFVKFPPEIWCHVLAVGVLEITIIFNRDSDIQIFLNEDVFLNGSWVDLDGTLKWNRGRAVVVRGERHQRSLAIRTQDTGHVSKFCVNHI